mmetsp:Transcript_21459/g.15361  ORF Transcript_21459/g.15361 Transcript_21459/m.15361 type:complete len:114 (+) Transcript_21459:563-904(+)
MALRKQIDEVSDTQEDDENQSQGAINVSNVDAEDNDKSNKPFQKTNTSAYYQSKEKLKRYGAPDDLENDSYRDEEDARLNTPRDDLDQDEGPELDIKELQSQMNNDMERNKSI